MTVKNANSENSATPLPAGEVERIALNNREADCVVLKKQQKMRRLFNNK
jgi:hypothetical protein